MIDIKNIKRLRSISINDDYVFHTIADVMNACFGKDWLGYQKNFIPLNDGSGYVVWLPGMAKRRNGKYIPFNKSNGWINVLSDDGCLLIEENANDTRTVITTDEKLPRYLFGHYEDGPFRNGRLRIGEKGGYRFLGVFVIDLNKSVRGKRIYNRIADNADLSKYYKGFSFPSEKEINTNMTIDDELVSELRKEIPLVQYDFEYKESPQKPREVLIRQGVKVYPRNKQTAINALAHADYLCEIDREHPTFIRKNSKINYTEPHHLIPLAFQDQFSVSLDVEENIVSLCSNCHNEIHYGKDADKLIEKLYLERRKLLLATGINVTLDDVLSMYGY